VGKTTIFWMISEASGEGGGGFEHLFRYDFEWLELIYTDGCSLRVIRGTRSEREEKGAQRLRGFEKTEIVLRFSLSDEKGRELQIAEIQSLTDDEFSPGAPRTEEAFWRQTRSRIAEDRALKRAYGTGVVFEPGQRPYFWRKEGEEFPVWEWLQRVQYPAELRDLHKLVAERYGRVFFLQSQRLSEARLKRSLGNSPADRLKRRNDFVHGSSGEFLEEADEYAETTPKIKQQSTNVVNRIRKLASETAVNNMNLGSSFIAEVLEKLNDKKLQKSEKEIRDEVIAKAVRIERLKLLLGNIIPLDENFNPAMNFLPKFKSVLALSFLDSIYGHLEENYKSLREFVSQIYELQEKLNERFKGEKVFNVRQNGFEVTSKDRESPIPLTELSSGEQHQIVMLYWFLFEVDSGSLVLIDEPEISLHLEWQKLFAFDMEAAIKQRNIQVIAATHSPEIIGHRSDCERRIKRSNG